MPSQRPPARLHVLMATHAPYAVIIRRGPARRVCTIGWDRKTDRFEIGQWLRGRIYEERADLSPDGRHLIYFAANFNWHSETKGTWTAISRAPYIKAISIWAKGDTYFGGGLFLDGRTALLHGHHGDVLQLSRDIHVVQEPRTSHRKAALRGYVVPGGVERLETLDQYLSPQEHAIYEASRQQRFSSYRTFKEYRDGWRLNENGEEDLRKWWVGCAITKHWWLRRPCENAGYQLRRHNTDLVIDLPAGTTWAGHDNWRDIERPSKQSRIIWAREGRLFAAEVTRSGMGEHKMLYDFNPMTFEPIEAPY